MTSVPGAAIYLVMVILIAKRVGMVFRATRHTAGFIAAMLCGVAGSLAAMFVADMFVPYMRFEVRIWFICLLWVLWRQAIDNDAVSPSGRADASRISGARRDIDPVPGR